MRPNNKDALFVGIQLLLFLAHLFNIKSLDIDVSIEIQLMGSFLFFIGTVICLIAIVQLNRNLSVFPTPKENSNLIETGLYKYIRHPIYTGLITAGLGFSVYSDSGYRLIVTFLLFVLFYFKSIYEEERLSEIFTDYPKYMKRSGRFLPKF